MGRKYRGEVTIICMYFCIVWSLQNMSTFSHIKLRKLNPQKWEEIKSKTEYKKKNMDLTVCQINNISPLDVEKEN